MSLYISGLTDEGKPLLAGVWRIKHQDGFPIEMSYLIARDKDILIDWMEAMADASTDDNLPALWDEIQQVLPPDQQTELKIRFMALLKRYDGDYAAIVKMKKDKGDEYHGWEIRQITELAPHVRAVIEDIQGLKEILDSP